VRRRLELWEWCFVVSIALWLFVLVGIIVTGMFTGVCQ
jgi:hypothetical protein